MQRSWILECGAFVVAATALLGCKTIPEGRSSVDAVHVSGTKQVDADDVEAKIATAESSKFLGVFRGVVFEYSTFDRFVLQRDLARVEAFYRTKGFYDAHARAGRVYQKDNHVEIEIVVDEGEPIRVRDVRVEGLENLPEDVALAARKSGEAEMGGKESPFEEEKYEKAEGAIRRALSDRGWAAATVKRDAVLDLVTKKADAIFTVTPGNVSVFGEVTIEGLGPLPEYPVRRAIDIPTGERYSEAALDSAQQALLDLGVFASVEVRPDLTDPSTRAVPIRVKVEPSRLRTWRLGGGIELDSLKSDVHVMVGWEHRNFLGGLRTFSIQFRPGVVFYPLRFNNWVAPEKFLPEEKLRVELRQPGFIEARTNGFIRPEFNVQALLLTPNPPPEQRVIGYAEARNGIGLDRTFFGKLFGSISHNLQYAVPFSYVGSQDPTLGPILISYPELLTNLDFRNDRIHPRSGFYLGNSLQVAGGPFGGDAQDVKIQPDLRGYIPFSKRVVWASRASVGFLFARNYGGVVKNQQPIGTPNTEERTRDYQLTFFRGFFSGGPTSNRGYPLRGVGPHDVVPFISPDVEVERLNSFCQQEGRDCRTPTGGFSLWEASTEVRFVVDGPLSVATFCDASDVSPRELDIRFTHLHLSCGAGGRYDTPVGPIRLDIGYRIPGVQVLGGIPAQEREPDTFAFGIPIAVNIGIGEAY